MAVLLANQQYTMGIKMKKLLCIMLSAVCMLSLTACGDSEIKATIDPFPEFEGVDFEGNTITNDIFKEYDATVINFWSNGCGSCIAEMPELEEYFQNFKDINVNLIGVAASAGESDESKTTADTILKEKGVTYPNIIPDNNSSFYKDFICEISGYPTTYLVDKEGNMIGAQLIGVLKNQEENLMNRLEKMIQE